MDESLFPAPGEDVLFKKITYHGQGSAKMRVTFERDGKQHEIKLKSGREIHTDKALSKLFQLMGFNQDLMVYRDSVRVWFDKMSFEKFSAIFSNKYGQDNLSRFIWAHGKEDGRGWIDFKDVIFEARPKYEMRLTPSSI